MIEHLPFWIDGLFILTCVLVLVLFHYANGKPSKATAFIVLWSIIQSMLAFNGFYQNTDAFPPRFGLVIVPAVLIIAFGLLPKQVNWVAAHRNVAISSLLHAVRLPVEIVLYGLFTYKMIPELMTFEGRNFDIVMGITAPVMAYLVLKRSVNHYFLLAWNVLGLGLVLFILVNGLLSAELPFQQFGFEQPNRAVNFFPFVLLPATVVPMVIWTHVTDIIVLGKRIRP